jgi:hypothetical protein
LLISIHLPNEFFFGHTDHFQERDCSKANKLSGKRCRNESGKQCAGYPWFYFGIGFGNAVDFTDLLRASWKRLLLSLALERVLEKDEDGIPEMR